MQCVSVCYICVHTVSLAPRSGQHVDARRSTPLPRRQKIDSRRPQASMKVVGEKSVWTSDSRTPVRDNFLRPMRIVKSLVCITFACELNWTGVRELDSCEADTELGHWVIGSVGHLGHLSRTDHRVTGSSF